MFEAEDKTEAKEKAKVVGRFVKVKKWAFSEEGRSFKEEIGLNSHDRLSKLLEVSGPEVENGRL